VGILIDEACRQKPNIRTHTCMQARQPLDSHEVNINKYVQRNRANKKRT